MLLTLFKREFGFHVAEEDKKLPSMFWNPKLHKSPYKARFIAGATNCTTKHLSKLFAKALQVLLADFKEYSRVIYRNTGFNCDWGIDSSTRFLERVQNLKIRKQNL